MKVEHRFVGIKKLADESNFPEGTSQAARIAGACDKLALDGWEVVTQTWTSEHLLLRRKIDGPKPMDVWERKAVADTVLDTLIEQAMLPVDADKEAWKKEAWQPVMDALKDLSEDAP